MEDLNGAQEDAGGWQAVQEGTVTGEAPNAAARFAPGAKLVVNTAA